MICLNIDLQIIAMCIYFNKILLPKRNLCQTIFRGYFWFCSTLIINIEGKYHFFVHFWHQIFMALILVFSLLTLDMSVNNTYNSSISHILLFHNSEPC